jgi:hypothetical protein
MIDPTPNHPPLWQIMADAYIQSLVLHESYPCYAAEIRAIAAELANKESEWRAECSDMSAVQWLLAEADKAEAGE